jgi:hypothetical protein
MGVLWLTFFHSRNEAFYMNADNEIIDFDI